MVVTASRSRVYFSFRPFPQLEVDEEGRYTYCSPQVENYLGYLPTKMIGLTPFNFMPPEEVEQVRVPRRYVLTRVADLTGIGINEKHCEEC